MDSRTLRQATLEDVPYMMSIGEKLFKSSPYSVMSLDHARIREHLEKFIIEQGTEYLSLLSMDGEKPVGVLAAYAYTPLFSSDKTAVEVLWYLEEDYRKSRRATEMMAGYEYWAKLVGCKSVQYGLLESSPKGMAKMYKRIGAVQTETVYMKQLGA